MLQFAIRQTEHFGEAETVEAVQLFGNVAVVHYAAEYVFDYGNGTRKGEGDWRKFTPTWMKVGDEWQIIGGMCAAQKPVSREAAYLS